MQHLPVPGTFSRICNLGDRFGEYPVPARKQRELGNAHGHGASGKRFIHRLDFYVCLLLGENEYRLVYGMHRDDELHEMVRSDYVNRNINASTFDALSGLCGEFVRGMR